MRLDPETAAAGFRLESHDVLDSTNAHALDLARYDTFGPLWITARRQNAGRGRRGREWTSPPGNLYATLLLDDPAPARFAPQLSFAASLAVHEAILDRAPGLAGRLVLKWPNDILIGGAKLAGILIEGTAARGRLAVAIGIGVNCASHPAGTTLPATDLASAGAEVSAEHLFRALSAAMARRLAQWRRGDGFAAIRDDWLARATGIGGDVRVRLPDREFVGRFEALDDAGRLLVRVADGGIETIAAGDVFPLAETVLPARAAHGGWVG